MYPNEADRLYSIFPYTHNAMQRGTATAHRHMPVADGRGSQEIDDTRVDRSNPFLAAPMVSAASWSIMDHDRPLQALRCEALYHVETSHLMHARGRGLRHPQYHSLADGWSCGAIRWLGIG